MYVIGTAGHVDHGKSTLISALTGINPDRLKEERDRQMTIDLGFAWHKLPSSKEIGIIDVPGHRDFIENMLAGVGGIDAVLFVIAADEGVMPQSREHLNILNLLGIEKGLIVLTKVDQIEDEDWFDLVESDIRSLVQHTFLHKAPIIRVSAVKNIGLDDLNRELDELLENIKPKRIRTFPRLPIDRVFTLKGFGTIITGTLIDGTFSNGDQVSILPRGIGTRIRGIQTHKKKQDTAYPGNRTAVNLIGVEVNEIARGDVLCLPGTLTPTAMVDVKFELLKDCSGGLKHDDEVKLFIGTAQTIARIRIIGENTVEPGEAGFAQLMLINEIVCREGDRFILRRPSPQETIGGGSVIDANPTERHKRFKDKIVERFTVSAGDSIEDQLLMNISDQGVSSIGEISKNMEIPISELTEILSTLIGQKAITEIHDNDKEDISWLMTTEDWLGIEEMIINMVDDYHAQYPLRKGIDRNKIIKSLKLEKRVAVCAVNKLIKLGKLKDEGLFVCSPTFQIELSSEQKAIISRLDAVFAGSGNQPPSVSEVVEIAGEELYRYLLSVEKWVEISSSVVFRKDEIEHIIAKTKELLSSGARITVADFRDAFNTTRKYAVALLEYMDEHKITKRIEDFRILFSG